MRGATAPETVSGYDLVISTHTPHAGRDLGVAERVEIAMSFQLTRPMRGATAQHLHG